MAAVDIGSEEEEETDINFRTERENMGEGLDLPGVVKTATPFLKVKNITHQHGLC